MRVTSSWSTWGTNFYHWVSDGTITIKQDGKKYEYHIERGRVKSAERFNGRRKVSETIYGVSLRTWNPDTGRLTTDEKIKPNTTLSIIPRNHIEKTSANIYGIEGTLIRKLYGGSLRAERFVYKGRVKNKVAYDIRRGTKGAYEGLTILSPEGKVFAKLKGEIDFNYKNSILQEKHEGKTRELCLDFASLNIFKSRTHYVEVYYKSLKLRDCGLTENGQRIGKWVLEGKDVYYIQGVAIEKELYEKKPEDLDPVEVLNIENVQVRAAFLKKIGLERVIKSPLCKVIDTDEPRGYQLFELPIKASPLPAWNRRNNTDATMMILKVKCPSTGAFYCLRVPPTMKTCEQARQWTFGLNEPTEKEYIELQKET